MPEKTVTTPEQIADELAAQGKYREAAEEYAKAYRPFQGFAHLVRIAKKQTEAMRQLFRREPR